MSQKKGDGLWNHNTLLLKHYPLNEKKLIPGRE